jgi:predicted CoA-binding protein
MTTPTLETKVQDFLAQKRIAVAGVSRRNGEHPVGNLIYHRLKETGHDVYAVNPHMQTFEGDRCYPNLQSIPGGVDGVVIVTRPPTTEQIVHDCSQAGSAASGCTNPSGRDRASLRRPSSTVGSTRSA